MNRQLRVLVDAIGIFALFVLFAIAIDRGGHWIYWRVPVLTLAIYLFSWTLERFPERGWVHSSIVVARVLIVLAACWAEIHVAR